MGDSVGGRNESGHQSDSLGLVGFTSLSSPSSWRNWCVTVRPILTGTHRGYHGNNTPGRGHATRAVHARRRLRVRDPLDPSEKARAQVVSVANVSFRLCTSRGTSGSSFERPSADGSQCRATTVCYHPTRITPIHTAFTLVGRLPLKHPLAAWPNTVPPESLTLSRLSRVQFHAIESLTEITRNISECSTPLGQRKREFHWFNAIQG